MSIPFSAIHARRRSKYGAVEIEPFPFIGITSVSIDGVDRAVRAHEREYARSTRDRLSV